MIKSGINIDIKLKRPHTIQLDMINNHKRFNVACLGRRSGKTEFAKNRNVNYVLQGKRIGYFAPTNKSMMDVWRQTKHILQPITKFVSVQDKIIETITGGYIDFWSLENETMRGGKYHCVIIDEAAQVKKLDVLWEQAIRPMLMDYNGSAWFLSTPKGRNYFKTLFDNQDKFDSWKSWQLPTSCNPYISETEIEEFRNTMPSIVFQQEILAEFVDFTGALLKRENVQYIDYIPDDLQYFMGMDLAVSQKQEADYNSIVVIGKDKQGMIFVVDVLRFKNLTYKVYDTIQNIYNKWKPSIITIEDVQFQSSFVQEIVRKSTMPIQGSHKLKVKGDKVNRFYSILAKYEQGFVKHYTRLIPEFEQELFGFPYSEHDDMVDALSYAYLSTTRIPGFMF